MLFMTVTLMMVAMLFAIRFAFRFAFWFAFRNGLLHFNNGFITDDIQFGFGIDLAICQLSADCAVLQLPDPLSKLLELLKLTLPSLFASILSHLA